ncbi:hypothetical protein ECE50_010615 [Chitinophaga sp. Mgbs1]|uniref:Uncharacterized protein n=1 Tax=Chitinophaga solisilvae TaxID=1233460 RepID=A0A9Q5D461_9BACT|nr:hypothetical protein [Chitinophaga solisilvae]
MGKGYHYIAMLLVCWCACTPPPALRTQLEEMAGLPRGSIITLDSFPLKGVSVMMMKTDTQVYTFLRHTRWQLADSGFEASQFLQADINGDRQPDIAATGIADVYGMRTTHIYLQRGDSFRTAIIPRNACEARYDSLSGLVRSFYQAGANGIHLKEEYSWRLDTLLLKRGVRLDCSDPRYMTTSWYHRKGAAIVTDKTLQGGPSYFDTAFWPLYYNH